MKTGMDLSGVPLISVQTLARALGIGPNATRSAAKRAGIELSRLPNGRESPVSLHDAEQIARQMQRPGRERLLPLGSKSAA